MYKDNIISVVVPCYNEERNLPSVVRTLPKWVDYIIVVDDCSNDSTQLVLGILCKEDVRIVNLLLPTNEGVGGAIATGYKKARDLNSDVTLVMAGDGQMDPAYMSDLISPIIQNGYDYVKTNRLFDQYSKVDIPRIRYLGNSALSFLTKISTGYWNIGDAQSGYTAISKNALQTLNWDSMYKRYGQPNDLLGMLNAYDFKALDVHTPPRYNVGEVSKMKIRKTLFTIPKILIKRFIWRLWVKYTVRSTNPLVLLYLSALILYLIAFVLFLHILLVWISTGSAPVLSSVALMFSLALAMQSTAFAMWMDFEYNRHLHMK